MAITKTTEIARIEVVGTWNVQVAADVVLKEDGTEIGRTRHRHVLSPFIGSYSHDTKSWSYTATDISKEDATVQAVANAVWTDSVKAAFKTFNERAENVPPAPE